MLRLHSGPTGSDMVRKLRLAVISQDSDTVCCGAKYRRQLAAGRCWVALAIGLGGTNHRSSAPVALVATVVSVSGVGTIRNTWLYETLLACYRTSCQALGLLLATAMVTASHVRLLPRRAAAEHVEGLGGQPSPLLCTL